MNPAITLFGKAIDRACEADRLWFERHAHRQFRLRNVVPWEFNGPIEEAPPGKAWRVLVAQLKPGVRARSLLAVAAETSNESVQDHQLRPLFEDLTGWMATQANASEGEAA